MNLLLDIKHFLIPEIIITLLIIANVIFSVSLKEKHQKYLYYFNFAGIAISLFSFRTISTLNTTEILNGVYLSDSFYIIARVGIILGCLFTIFISKNLIEKLGKNKGEYFAILLTATLGATLLVGSNDLIMVLTALETLGLSSYMLSAILKNDKRSNEAGLKYLIIGGVAVAVVLYGLSFVYGMTAETNIYQIFLEMKSYQPDFILSIAGLLVVSGLCFKVSAIPFYNWTPDVYEGAPLPVAAYLSVVSKIAGFVILSKIIFSIFYNDEFLSTILAIIAVITMSIGNLIALKQTNIKRLMAYSTIAQAGYILAGLALFSKVGISAVAYYLMIYFFMNFGAWAAIEIFESKTQKTDIKDFSGIAYKNPLFTLCFSICLISLAGIPITAGFFAKLYLFMIIAISNHIYLIMLLIALINTLIALYYYLNIIKVMFETDTAKDFNIPQLMTNESVYSNTILLVSTIVTIILGIFSSSLISFFQNITKNILS